jgi:hypothetical protein
MERLFSILRCSSIRCAMGRRKRVITILFTCIAFAVSSKLLLEENIYFRASSSANSLSGNTAHREFEYSAADRSPEAGSRTSSSVANLESSEANHYLPAPQLSRERFNAALAAGLIDPSRIQFTESTVPTLRPARERVMSQIGTPMIIPAPAQGKEFAAPFVKFAAAASTVSAPPNPTEAIHALPQLAPLANKMIVSSNQATKSEQEGLSTAPRRPAASIPTNRHFSVGLISRAGIGSAKSSSSEDSKSRRNPPTGGTRPVSSPARKADDGASPSRDLTENLQRFASDFVRANQTDNVAEEHRFFADSVHFYREGDLSLAGVVAATRRYHRAEQSKRSEVAAPAATTGPVNGGFFVIEQPVRWTESQGTKLKQGRSVLRLRVVPIDHGGWKITSIDEVGK